MKKVIVDKKDYILITPKQLQRMVDWFGMASNCGDNDITKADISLRDKCLEYLENEV